MKNSFKIIKIPTVISVLLLFGCYNAKMEGPLDLNSTTGFLIGELLQGSGENLYPEAFIKAPNAGSNDNFGYSTAISGDTIVVGAYGEDSAQTTITNGTTAATDNTFIDSGAVYVFTRSDSTWTQQAYLKAPNTDSNDGFGISIAISGDTIVVGANGDDSAQTTITNGATASADNTLTDSGAVYVFTRSDSTWTQQAYLKAPNAGAGDLFGSSIAISGDTIVAGADNEDSSRVTIINGTGGSSDDTLTDSGAAYVFTRSGSTWTQQAYLKAPNAGSYDYFGISTAISGDTIVVGAYGEDSSQTTITNGTTVVEDNTSTDSGAAYVFARSGSIWTQQAYLKAPNAGASDLFGTSTAISGNTIVVGAYAEDSSQTTITNGTTASADDSLWEPGAAYVFVRDTTNNTWAQQAYLKAPNPDSSGNTDYFGYSTAISGDTIVVGAYDEDNSQTTITNGTTVAENNELFDSGAAYVFTRSGSTWTQQSYLKAPNAGSTDFFGYSTAISGDTIVVGAAGEDSSQTTITNGTTAPISDSLSNSGAVYVFGPNIITGAYSGSTFDFDDGSLPSIFTGSWYIDSTASNCYLSTGSCLRSNLISHSSSTSISATVTVSSGNISFMRKVSSESGFDDCQFKIDGLAPSGEGSGVSGIISWTSYSYYVSAGEHTFTWTYAKDSSVSSGSDACWIDNVSFP